MAVVQQQASDLIGLLQDTGCAYPSALCNWQNNQNVTLPGGGGTAERQFYQGVNANGPFISYSLLVWGVDIQFETKADHALCGGLVRTFDVFDLCGYGEFMTVTLTTCDDTEYVGASTTHVNLASMSLPSIPIDAKKIRVECVGWVMCRLAIQGNWLCLAD